MKQNWQIFEKVLSGVHIILGLLILFMVVTTIKSYYVVFGINPLFDHKTILEVSFKKNYILFIVSLMSISSGFLLYNNSLKGWVTSIITWTMCVILLLFSYYRLSVNEYYHLDLVSQITICFAIILFITILVFLNNSEFKQKYKPTNKSWLIIFLSTLIITLAKFFYS